MSIRLAICIPLLAPALEFLSGLMYPPPVEARIQVVHHSGVLVLVSNHVVFADDHPEAFSYVLEVLIRDFQEMVEQNAIEEEADMDLEDVAELKVHLEYLKAVQELWNNL